MLKGFRIPGARRILDLHPRRLRALRYRRGAGRDHLLELERDAFRRPVADRQPQPGRLDMQAAQSGDYETADRLLRLRAGAEEAVKAGSISSDAAEKWLADLRAAMETGDVLLHSDTFLFTAKAPDNV